MSDFNRQGRYDRMEIEVPEDWKEFLSKWPQHLVLALYKELPGLFTVAEYKQSKERKLNFFRNYTKADGK